MPRSLLINHTHAGLDRLIESRLDLSPGEKRALARLPKWVKLRLARLVVKTSNDGRKRPDTGKR